MHKIYTSSSAPTIEMFPGDLCTVEGKNITLNVLVSGKPDPSFIWYFNRNELIVSDHSMITMPDGSLVIYSIKIRNTGEYTLIATNAIGTAEDTVSIVVRSRDFQNLYKTKSELPSIPLEHYGFYVAQGHSNNNQEFKKRFKVHSILTFDTRSLYIPINFTVTLFWLWS